jgi:hypothetical protein
MSPRPSSPRCPWCKRPTPVKTDGTFKSHRPDADSFIGPRCTGSGRVHIDKDAES